MKKELIFLVSILLFQYGAGGGSRTHTPSLALDFESNAAAITPRRQQINYN